MKTCVILSGGPWHEVEMPRSDYVIACDKGYAYADRLGIRPHLVIGDFDSYQGEIASDIPVITLPTHKNDTDTGYAIAYALAEGYRDIRVYFALGARLDHTLANLQSAAHAARQGARIALYGIHTRLYLLHNSALTLSVDGNQALSVLAFTDSCHDVCIEGAAYPLSHATLTNDYPLGVSNEAVGTVHISAGEGVLLVSLCTA